MVCSFNRLNELVEFSAKFVEVLLRGLEDVLIGQGACFLEDVKVIHGFIARRLGVSQESNEIVFVSPPSVSLDDVCSNRLNGPPDLTSFFVHLVLWEHVESYLVDLGRKPFRQQPDFELAIAHCPTFCAPRCVRSVMEINELMGGSSIEYRVSSIENRVSSISGIPPYLR
jgi:hypothetical protein